MFKNYGLASGGDGISVPGFVLYSVIALAFYGACQIYAQKKEAIEAPNKMIL